MSSVPHRRSSTIGGAVYRRARGAGARRDCARGFESALRGAIRQKPRPVRRIDVSATGANQAAGYQLATGDAVMPIGGFMGGDPSPTLARFQQDVADGQIHYYIEGPGPDTPPERQAPGTQADQIGTWVKQHFTANTVDGVTFYDLTAPLS